MKQIIEHILQETDVTDTSWQKLRMEARATLARLGLPTPKTEAWKYTPIAKYIADIKHQAMTGDLVSYPPVATSLFAHMTVGILDVDHFGMNEHIPGVEATFVQDDERIGTIATQETDALAALNTATMQGAGVLKITAHTKVKQPIYIALHGRSETASLHATRLYVEVGAGAEVTIVEEALGENDKQLQNHVVEIHAAQGAKVHYYALQTKATQSVFVGARYWKLEADAKGLLYTYNTAPHCSRNHTGVEIQGTHAHMDIGGLALGQGQALVDTQIRVAHMVPDATSTQVIRGIYDDTSKGIFQGRIYVAPHASGTNADQQSKNLLVSPQATVNVQPLLEIYNDDVKCTHGTSSGFIDTEALFYLRSRGVPEGVARTLLLESFFEDSLALVEYAPLRHVLTTYLHASIEQPAVSPTEAHLHAIQTCI